MTSIQVTKATPRALRGCGKTVASGPKARRTAPTRDPYQLDGRGASTAQRPYRVAQQICSQPLREHLDRIDVRVTVLIPLRLALRHAQRRACPRLGADALCEEVRWN